jgi:hypothetical protein
MRVKYIEGRAEEGGSLGLPYNLEKMLVLQRAGP